MDNIFIRVEEREFGPVSLEEVRGLVKEGSFSHEDYIWSEPLDAWVSADEAPELRDVFDLTNGGRERQASKIYAIAGGKGGVGKTVIGTSIGVGLASMGDSVVIVDGDLGGANIHTVMGILEPKYTFFDFYTLQKESLKDIVLDTPVENLRMISGATGTLGVANPKYYQKQRFMRELRGLDADKVILDLGAGATYNTLDFFLLADEQIIVISPEPTSIHEAFGFIKVCLLRELNRALKDHPAVIDMLALEELNRPGKAGLTVGDLLAKVKGIGAEATALFRSTLDSFKPRVILNMVKEPSELKEGKALQAACIEILSIDLDFLGYISYDDNVVKAVKAMQPFLLHSPKTQASQDLSALIRVNLLGKKGIKEIVEKRRWRKQFENYSNQRPENDFLNDAPICSIKCFYWGDCEFQDGGKACRVRHLDPILRQTKFN